MNQISDSLQKKLPRGTKKTLGGITLVQDQPEATVKSLEKICQWYWCRQGAQIFDRTDAGREVYFIVEGSARVIVHAPSGQEIAFDDISAGAHFGELSAIDGGERTATLYALEDSVLAAAPGEKFVDFVREHPEVAFRLTRDFAHMVRTLNDRVVGLSTTTVVQRVYGELLRLAEPDPQVPRRWIIDPLPQHRDIAIWAGTTPETVARAIGQLLKAEVVKRRHKTLFIFDRQRLQDLVDAS